MLRAARSAVLVGIVASMFLQGVEPGLAKGKTNRLIVVSPLIDLEQTLDLRLSSPPIGVGIPTGGSPNIGPLFSATITGIILVWDWVATQSLGPSLRTAIHGEVGTKAPRTEAGDGGGPVLQPGTMAL